MKRLQFFIPFPQAAQCRTACRSTVCIPASDKLSIRSLPTHKPTHSSGPRSRRCAPTSTPHVQTTPPAWFVSRGGRSLERSCGNDCKALAPGLEGYSDTIKQVHDEIISAVLVSGPAERNGARVRHIVSAWLYQTLGAKGRD